MNNEQITNRPCFLKATIDSAYTNIRFRSTIIGMNLTNLDQYMEVLEQNDITKFNDYVKVQIKLFAMAGETMSYLLMNLFKAYKNTKDKQFTPWVTNKANAWQEGALHLNPKGVELMDYAENYIKDATSMGEWLKLTDEEKKIITLKAQF